MNDGAPDEVERAIVEAHRRDWAVVLAATACTTRDLDVAEECVQEAFAAAVVAWTRDGVPNNPGAWLSDNGQAPGSRRDSPRGDVSFEDALAGGARRERRRRRRARRTHQHRVKGDRERTNDFVSSSCAVTRRWPGGADGTDASTGVWNVDRRHRSTVLGFRDDDGRADHESKTEDSDGAHPVAHAGRCRDARAPACGTRRHLSALHDGPHRDVRFDADATGTR